MVPSQLILIIIILSILERDSLDFVELRVQREKEEKTFVCVSFCGKDLLSRDEKDREIHLSHSMVLCVMWKVMMAISPREIPVLSEISLLTLSNPQPLRRHLFPGERGY